MANQTYDLDVAKGTDWLSRDVYQSIKEEVSSWPSWKQSAYGVGGMEAPRDEKNGSSRGA